MARRLLDTNVLVGWWRINGGNGRLDKVRHSDVSKWALDLLELYNVQGIVSPVYLEFLCGISEQSRMELAERFVETFRVLDQWKITNDDLLNSKRIARRIPRNGKPRQFGDCLIRAIAKRLRYDVITLDRGFPT